MRRLRIFNDQNHSHQAQNPIAIDVANFHSSPQFNVELSELN
jgi:ribosomal protein L13